MREMGTAAGVPIEPPEQTELLNACTSVAGVIGGGVPGGASHVIFFHANIVVADLLLAGGYDAIWILVFDPSGCPPEDLPSSRVESLWAGWKTLDVSPLSASESSAKGVRAEKLEDVPGLKGIVA
jgi:phosphomevalonate kinase